MLPKPLDRVKWESLQSESQRRKVNIWQERPQEKRQKKKQGRADFQMFCRGHASALHGSRRSSRCTCDPWGGGTWEEETGGGHMARDPIRLPTNQSVHQLEIQVAAWGRLCEGVFRQTRWFVLLTRCLFETSVENLHHRLQPKNKASFTSGQPGHWDHGKFSLSAGYKYTLLPYWWKKNTCMHIAVHIFGLFYWSNQLTLLELTKCSTVFQKNRKQKTLLWLLWEYNHVMSSFGLFLQSINMTHLPPATSRGPFFFLSSCRASVNSFPPFFSRALPANRERRRWHHGVLPTEGRRGGRRCRADRTVKTYRQAVNPAGSEADRQWSRQTVEQIISPGFSLSIGGKILTTGSVCSSYCCCFLLQTIRVS